MSDGEMLGQCAEIGVLARLPGGWRLLDDGGGTSALVCPQGKLVEELPNSSVEVFARTGALRHHSERLAQTLRSGRVSGEPIGARCKSLGHREQIVGAKARSDA